MAGARGEEEDGGVGGEELGEGGGIGRGQKGRGRGEERKLGEIVSKEGRGGVGREEEEELRERKLR